MWASAGGGQSPVILRSTMIFFHLAASCATSWANCAGVPVAGSMPSLASLSRTSGSLTA